MAALLARRRPARRSARLRHAARCPDLHGKLPDDIVKTVLGCAQGRYGTTLDYVSRTVKALRESGMPDRALEALLKRCL